MRISGCAAAGESVASLPVWQMLPTRPPEKGFSAVAIVDTERMVRLSLLPICPTAHGEGLSADEKTLYVTCALSDELAIVDAHIHYSHDAWDATPPDWRTRAAAASVYALGSGSSENHESAMNRPVPEAHITSPPQSVSIPKIALASNSA